MVQSLIISIDLQNNLKGHNRETGNCFPVIIFEKAFEVWRWNGRFMIFIKTIKQ